VFFNCRIRNRFLLLPPPLLLLLLLLPPPLLLLLLLLPPPPPLLLLLLLLLPPPPPPPPPLLLLPPLLLARGRLSRGNGGWQGRTSASRGTCASCDVDAVRHAHTRTIPALSLTGTSSWQRRWPSVRLRVW
jgi:hypothetical protein